MESGKTIKCENCRCEIDEKKYILHQRFCLTNMKYCEKCHEAFPVDEFEEHLEFHKSRLIQEEEEEKKEPKEPEDLSLKKKNSLRRLSSLKIGCGYCELPCTIEELEEHEKMCGSRTVQCGKCGKTILIKDQKEHQEKFHNKNEEFKKMDSGISGNIGMKRTDSNVKRQMEEDEALARALADSMKDFNINDNNNYDDYNYY